jgi:cytochrome c biogenesis protein CcmG, thiol:disulfide interchange protein DsbE
MNKQRLILFVPLAILLLLGVLFWRGLSLNPGEKPSALINKPFPEFNLSLLPAEENPANLIRASRSNIIGQVSLVNVWATWCVTCRAEHEFLNQLKAEGVIIYGIYYPIDYNEEKVTAQVWLRDLHNPYVFSVIDEERKLGMDLGVYGAPETFVLDKKGMIRHRHVGDVNQQVWTNKLKPLIQALEKE